MRTKNILKGELREKHKRARSSVKIATPSQPKQPVPKEEPVKAEEEPVVRKRSRKAQARKAEVPAVAEEKTEYTSENNE